MLEKLMKQNKNRSLHESMETDSHRKRHLKKQGRLCDELMLLETTMAGNAAQEITRRSIKISG